MTKKPTSEELASRLGEMTDESRKAALAKGLEVRRARALIKSRMKAGEISPHEVLCGAFETDRAAQGITLAQFVGACPGIGKKGAQRIVADLGIAPTRRLRSLGPVQRERLGDLLAEAMR